MMNRVMHTKTDMIFPWTMTIVFCMRDLFVNSHSYQVTHFCERAAPFLQNRIPLSSPLPPPPNLQLSVICLSDGFRPSLAIILCCRISQTVNCVGSTPFSGSTDKSKSCEPGLINSSERELSSTNPPSSPLMISFIQRATSVPSQRSSPSLPPSLAPVPRTSALTDKQCGTSSSPLTVMTIPTMQPSLSLLP